MVNSSSCSNDSLLLPFNSSIDSLFNLTMECFMSRSNFIVFSMFNITNILLLLPLCIFILHHGLQQWRQTRSTSSAATSHSESFTYHLVTMEIIGVSGSFLCFCAIYMKKPIMLMAGLYFFSFTYFGEMFFHILTCLERYLAVVHPITYLSLRNERGIRIRNICIGCVWPLNLLGLGLPQSNGASQAMVVNFLISFTSLTIVSFCSVSVLCVLIRPGPGEQGGARKRVDKSKQRAFYTIAAILGVLMLRFVWDLVWAALSILVGVSSCVLITWSFWMYMPSSLVLPLLFLLTKEKLNRKYICCKYRRN